MVKLMKHEPYRGNLAFMKTPIGRIGLVENGSSLTHLFFEGEKGPVGAKENETDLLVRASLQLEEYFNGHRLVFDLPLAPFGTEFQRLVWGELMKIKYGQKKTYGQVAEAIGHALAFRAVGQANNRNPIAIIIPCHRVIGAGGSLTGYAGGLGIKEYLLKHEENIICDRASQGMEI